MLQLRLTKPITPEQRSALSSAKDSLAKSIASLLKKSSAVERDAKKLAELEAERDQLTRKAGRDREAAANLAAVQTQIILFKVNFGETKSEFGPEQLRATVSSAREVIRSTFSADLIGQVRAMVRAAVGQFYDTDNEASSAITFQTAAETRLVVALAPGAIESMSSHQLLNLAQRQIAMIESAISGDVVFTFLSVDDEQPDAAQAA